MRSHAVHRRVLRDRPVSRDGSRVGHQPRRNRRRQPAGVFVSEQPVLQPAARRVGLRRLGRHARHLLRAHLRSLGRRQRRPGSFASGTCAAALIRPGQPGRRVRPAAVRRRARRRDQQRAGLADHRARGLDRRHLAHRRRVRMRPERTRAPRARGQGVGGVQRARLRIRRGRRRSRLHPPQRRVGRLGGLVPVPAGKPRVWSATATAAARKPRRTGTSTPSASAPTPLTRSWPAVSTTPRRAARPRRATTSAVTSGCCRRSTRTRPTRSR